jgi:type IV secretory pathway component VirB8
MTPTPLPSPLAENLKEGMSRYLELHSSTEVTNSYLKVAVLALSCVCLGLIAFILHTNPGAPNQGPLVVAIDSEGRAQAIPYESVVFHPQERVFRYFLSNFVKWHYSRMRATIKEGYSQSLYFLDAELADALIASNKNSKEIETFLAGEGEENDVEIKNVSIQDLRTSPYHATVDFEKVYYRSDHQESRREKYVANFLFVVKDHVPNNFIPINPLGLTITYFREDQSFNP